MVVQMQIAIVFLVGIFVKATDSDDEFFKEVMGLLSKPEEFPPFMLQSSDLNSNTCTYSFDQGTSSRYFLRPGAHLVQDLRAEPMSGRLNIEAQEGCGIYLWKANQRWELFGTVSKESDTNVIIEWPAVAISEDSLVIDLSLTSDHGTPCTYNLLSGKVQIHQMLSMCANQLRLTHDYTHIHARNLPMFFTYNANESTDTKCIYSYVQRTGIPYWLRVGDHRRQMATLTHVVLRIQTRMDCIPQLFKYDTSWKPFGSVRDYTTSAQMSPGNVRQQDTTYAVIWRAPPSSDILLHLPPLINGNVCLYELEAGLISVARRNGQPCSYRYPF